MPLLRLNSLAAGVAVAMAATLTQAASLAAQEESVALRGESVAVYNLAGTVTIRAGSGSHVTVTVRRNGSDASRLEVVSGRIDIGRRDWNDVDALRIIYPADEVRYDAFRGRTQLHVRDDGTFWGGRNRSGRRVEISDRGSGLDASADLEISVPRGKRLLVALAAGTIAATNVAGDLYLDTGSGSIRTSGTDGILNLDTGSGDVTVNGARGDVNIDTGSGNVDVTSVTGPDLNIDTGSGDVRVDGVDAPSIGIDTGSGDVTVLGARTGNVSVDTGSGNVEVVTVDGNASFNIDTGSGDVTIAVPDGYAGDVDLETSSGGMSTDIPLTLLRKDDDEIQGRIGGGGPARISVETGSGDIILRRS